MSNRVAVAPPTCSLTLNSFFFVQWPPIPTTIIGPSSLSAVMPDSGHLRSSREVGSVINHEILLAQRASLILGVALVRRGKDRSATTANT
jgi:hypothetical protein